MSKTDIQTVSDLLKLAMTFPAILGQYQNDHRRRRRGFRVSLTMLKNLSEFFYVKICKENKLFSC